MQSKVWIVISVHNLEELIISEKAMHFAGWREIHKQYISYVLK